MTDYLKAKRNCDLVMKGGITSGVLYPPAICRIAENFHLVGIGGTSAGAIAACAAAAAEYRRRQHGDGAGFEKLEALPYMLAGQGRLKGLFRPDGATKELFDLFLDATQLKDKSFLHKIGWSTRAVWTWVRNPGVLSSVVGNGYGLTTGLANENRPEAGEIEPLTEWLARIIDDIAGMNGGKPLTFGDLRHAKVPTGFEGAMGGVETKSIDLRAVTTCVSFGRPFELPMEGHRIFAFDPKEWARLFPKKIMDHIIGESEKIPGGTLRRDGKLPFPTGDAMPVVVAARMSLSFPYLFTMIPLYACNYHDRERPLKKVWFSDGGITSNLPIHRFDSLFPNWPTLAINLQYTGKDGKPGRRNIGDDLIYMIRRLEDGTRDLWHPFQGKSALGSLMGFAGAIFRSAQVWHDNAFLRLPGYRDRVVEIWLKPDEGGMNLDMPEATIRRLVERGSQAGVQIRDRFASDAPGEPLSWDGHRWVRLRSALAGLAEYLHAFRHTVDNPMPDDRKLPEFMAAIDAPPSYKFRSKKQLAAARQAVEELLVHIGRLESTDACLDAENARYRPFCDGPRPPIEIGSRAPL